MFMSLAIGAFWLPVALVSPVIATVMIWIMLVGAIAALQKGIDAQPRWIAVWPIALYAGWLTAASFVSIGLLLGGYGFVSEFNAAIIALGLATGFGAMFAFRLKSWPYGIAVAWGFMGIAVANLAENPVLTAAATVSALLVLILSISNLKRV